MVEIVLKGVVQIKHQEMVVLGNKNQKGKICKWIYSHFQNKHDILFCTSGNSPEHLQFPNRPSVY